MDKNRIKSFLINLLSLLFKPIVPLWFWIYRWFKDQQFLIELQSQTIRPNLITYPAWFILSCLNLIKKSWSSVYIDYGIKRYTRWVGEHYSPTGRGYFNYENLSESQKLQLYGEPHGRLDYFIINYPQILKFRDEQSFLDAGCGRGQNIKILLDYYPNATIKAFDLNEGALNIVEKGTMSLKNISAEIGSVTDFSYLKQYSTNSFDHVILSHVFDFIMSESKSSTILIRQKIIDELVRISNGTIFILGGKELFHFGDPEFKIEQLQRGFFVESIVHYFEKHLQNGSIYLVFSPESTGLLFALSK